MGQDIVSSFGNKTQVGRNIFRSLGKAHAKNKKSLLTNFSLPTMLTIYKMKCYTILHIYKGIEIYLILYKLPNLELVN
jgi:hypothetical protein